MNVTVNVIFFFGFSRKKSMWTYFDLFLLFFRKIFEFLDIFYFFCTAAIAGR